MERRRESRLKISNPVKLKVLDRMAGPSLGRPIDAEILEMSGSGMRLRMTVPVPCGVPVEVDGYQRVTLFGEICRCLHEQDGSYTVGLRVFESMAIGDRAKSFFRARS